MRAAGPHLIVRLPEARKETEGGVKLADNSKQEFAYGRVISVGEDVPWRQQRGDNGLVDARKAEVGEIVTFSKIGPESMELDPHKDETGLVVIHHEMILTVLDDADIVRLKLPMPSNEDLVAV